MRDAVVASFLIVLSILVLAAHTIELVSLEWAAGFAFIALCFVGVGASTMREWLLFFTSIVLSIFLLRSQNGLQTFLQSIDLAAFFAAFIILITALKIAAERSRSVLAVGRHLLRQSPSKRFVTTAVGGHLLGIFLNFGAISLMAPLIQNAAKRRDGTISADVEQRQLSALLRGFAWILLWAPTTLTQAVLLTVFVEIDTAYIIVLGICTSLLMILLGMVCDRVEWRHHRPKQFPVLPFPYRALINLATTCICLISATATLKAAWGFSTALSLMFVAPTVTVFWFALQCPPDVLLQRQIKSLWLVLQTNSPSLARSAIALGLSGFIGRATVDVLPMDTLLAHMDLANIPGWMFLSIFPVLITLGGQFALSPIILVVFIGQLLQTIPNLPSSPNHIVFALSAGWAISMFASPNATATLLIAATTNIPPTRLTWGWNLHYALLSYLILVAIFILIEADWSELL